MIFNRFQNFFLPFNFRCLEYLIFYIEIKNKFEYEEKVLKSIEFHLNAITNHQRHIKGTNPNPTTQLHQSSTSLIVTGKSLYN